MKTFLSLLFAFSIVLFTSFRSFAQTWTSAANTINGGSIVDVIRHGQTLLTSTKNAGIYKSLDNGQTWQQSNTGFASSSPMNFAIKGDTIYLGDFGGGVYYSINDGQNWQQTSFFSRQVTHIHFAGNRLFASTVNGVFVSADRGKTFTDVSSGLPGSVSSLSRDVKFVGHHGNFLFAGVVGGGLYRSAANTINWTRVTDLPDNASPTVFFEKDGLLYVGGYLGLYLSADSGASWIKIGAGVPESGWYTGLAAKDGKLYASTWEGFYVSSNNGSTFSRIPLPNPVFTWACDYLGNVEGELFVNPREQGLLRSGDGITFTESNTGLNALFVLGFHRKENVAFAMTSRGTYKSADDGKTWSLMGIYDNFPFYYVATKGDSIIAHALRGGVMFSSTDQGESWEYFPHSGPSGSINLLTSFVNKNGVEIAYGSAEDGIYEYRNANLGWVKILSTTNQYFDQILRVGDSLVTSSVGNMYMSRNEGATWEIKNNGLPASFFSNSYAAHKKKIYAVTAGALYVTENFGEQWVKTQGTYQGWASSIVSDGNFLFLGTGQGLYFSSDDGVSWIEYNDSNSSKRAIVSIKKINNTILAATFTGVWYTELNFDPAIISFLPTSGNAGTTVTITGKFFSPVQTSNTVRVNGVQAEVVVASSKEMIIKIPQNATSGPITITVGGVTATSTAVFCIRPAKPTVTFENPSLTLPVLVSSSAVGNQWFKNGSIIPGAIQNTYTSMEAGTYSVQITTDGCSSDMSASYCVNPLPPVITQVPTGGAFPSLTSSSTTGNQWIANGNDISGATQQSYVVTTSGVYSVRVIVGGCTSNPSNPVCIPPSKPVVTTTTTVQGYVLSSSSATNNQWYRNGILIPGATSQVIDPTESGNYTVKVSNGTCVSEASAETVFTSSETISENLFNIYPTRVSDWITVDLISFEKLPVEIAICDGLGRLRKQVILDGGDKVTIDVNDVSQGVYFLRASQHQRVATKRFVKE